jgi:hypothetical protein
MYANDKNQKFPPKLADLVPNYLVDKKALVHRGYGKHAADGVDFAYVAGLRAGDPGRWILIYESVPGKDGRRLAGFCDGRVSFLTAERFKASWAEQEAALKKAGRKYTVMEPAGVARGGGGDGDALSAESLINLLTQMANPATMPPADVISKHLFPAVGVTRKVPGGLLTESFGPLGFSGGGITKPAAVLGLGMMTLWGGRMRARPARVHTRPAPPRKVGKPEPAEVF